MKIKDVLKNEVAFQTLLKYLEKLPNDEVIPNIEIQEILGITTSAQSIRRHSAFLKDYHHTLTLNGRVTRVWGNKKAIATLRGQSNEN